MEQINLLKNFYNPKSGAFIVVEGPDGCGKTTLLKNIQERLLQGKPDLKCLYVKEPGDTPIGEFARNWVRTTDAMEDAAAVTQALYLFSASRIELLKHKVIPALNAGYLVFSDRFALSTAVYQDLNPMFQMHDLVMAVLKQLEKFIHVDMTLYISTQADMAAERLHARAEQGGDSDINDNRGSEHYNLLDYKYITALGGLELSRKLIGRVEYINGALSEADMCDMALEHIGMFLAQKQTLDSLEPEIQVELDPSGGMGLFDDVGNTNK